MLKLSFFIFFGFILALIVFAISFFDKNAFINALNKYNLLPQPESFTELYFEDHLKLPKSFQMHELYSFKFTVHNLENKDTLYNYTVTASASDSASLLDKGTFTLKHDQSKTIKENFRIRSRHPMVKFNVSLTNKNQSIHFYTENLYK